MIYAMVGENSKDLITYNGKVLVHEDKAEMEFIFPMGMKVVMCPRDITPEMMMDIKFHPDLASFRWPIKRGDFRSG